MSESTADGESLIVGQHFSPPMVGVVNFTLGVSPAEFLLTYGRSRVMFDPKTGMPEGTPAVEWLQSISLSPAVAKQLSVLLQNAIQAYEGKQGIIPDLSKA